jgi:hypothetical protein
VMEPLYGTAIVIFGDKMSHRSFWWRLSGHQNGRSVITT